MQKCVGACECVGVCVRSRVCVPTQIDWCSRPPVLFYAQVPNLFPKDELGSVLDEVRAAAKAAGAGETGEQVGGLSLAALLPNLPCGSRCAQ